MWEGGKREGGRRRWEAGGRGRAAEGRQGSGQGLGEAAEEPGEGLGEVKCVQNPVFYQSKCRGRSFRVAFGGSSGTLTDSLR